MIVHVQRFGSVWHERVRPDLPVRIWNTTGIDDGKRLLPRSRVFGQVSLGKLARIEANRYGRLSPGYWLMSEVTEYKGIRRLHLHRRAPSPCTAEWYLKVVTEGLVGCFREDFCDAENTKVVSHSVWRGHQEVMLLVRPFAWLKGERGTATLIPGPDGGVWRLEEWSRP